MLMRKTNTKKLIISDLEIKQHQNSKEANRNKNHFMAYQISMLILAILIPLFVLIFEIMELPKSWQNSLIASISTIMMVLSLLNLYKYPQTKWIHYRANSEELKREKYLYKFKVGQYTALTQVEADTRLKKEIKKRVSTDQSDKEINIMISKKV